MGRVPHIISHLHFLGGFFLKCRSACAYQCHSLRRPRSSPQQHSKLRWLGECSLICASLFPWWVPTLPEQHSQTPLTSPGVAATHNLQFWQNDWGILLATAARKEWNGYKNESAQEVTLKKKNPAAEDQTYELPITSLTPYHSLYTHSFTPSGTRN